MRLTKIWMLLLLTATLVACGGGSDGNPTSSQAPATVVGSFYSEQSIDTGKVTIKDGEGTVLTTYTDINGVYYFDTSELIPPFVIMGSYVSDSQTYSYYSYVDGDFSSTDNVTANISEFTSLATTLLVAQSGYGVDPATLYTESDSTITVIFSHDNSQEIEAIIDFLCPILLGENGEYSQEGCSLDGKNNFINTPYSADPSVDDVEKLNQLINLNIDIESEELQLADSSGNIIAIISIDAILDGTVADAPINEEIALEVNDTLGQFEKRSPFKNEGTVTGLSSSNKVIGVVDYVANYYGANVIVDNLVECPIEIRNFLVKLDEDNSVNASDYPAPYVRYPDAIDILNIDTSPDIKVNTPSAKVHPIDECKGFEFKYQFQFNLVIRKEKFYDPTTGSSVWKYDNPACEAYSIKAVEEYYQNIAVAPNSFSNPVIEVRPGPFLFPGHWPLEGISNFTFVYSSDCTLVADFSVSPADGEVPLIVDANASNSVGDIASYDWSTSTGLTSSEMSPSFTFDTVGSHSITLTVTDSNENTETMTKTITVADLPQAAFTWQTSTTSFVIDVDAGSSTGADVSSYQWITSEGGSASGSTASLNFSSTGNYTVTLTITDKYGNTSTVTVAVTVDEIDVTPVIEQRTTCTYVQRTDGKDLYCAVYDDNEQIISTRTEYKANDLGYYKLNIEEAHENDINEIWAYEEIIDSANEKTVIRAYLSQNPSVYHRAQFSKDFQVLTLFGKHVENDTTLEDYRCQEWDGGSYYNDWMTQLELSACPYSMDENTTEKVHSMGKQDMWLETGEYQQFLE